ncbi:MAG: metal-sensing transcriptional repressor [Flavobacteriales bacterium]
MIPKDLSRDIIDRVNTVKGQMEGLNRMLEEGKEPERILEQFKAARNGLDQAEQRLMDEVYRKSLAIKIVEAAEACPGDCGNEERIQAIRERFPHLGEEDIMEKMKEIRTIAEKLENRGKGPSE